MYYLKADIRKPLQFQSAGLFTADAAWTHMQRILDNFEVIIGIHGTVFLQQEEERYELGGGDCLLLLPGHLHKGFAASPKGTSFFWFHFNCGEEFSVIDGKDAEGEISLSRNNPYFSGFEDSILLPSFFRPSNLERVSILLHQLLHISASGYYTKQAVNYILTSLAVELTEQALTGSSRQKGQEPRMENLSKITEWIRVHITNDISLKDLAFEFNYTREYLARYFRKHMGMSMQEYIHKMKMAKARELLVQSDCSIKEIASALGFSDDKYFLKLFKRYEKITPREYRRAYHRLHMNNV